ncbi:probable acyl-[acyl-carrier-protein]--UDP-n-acetylglucosamine o-acyltransferase mitochondrial [Phtheirospermum japonicum]|uniref:Probable acyl-[acyl-carrier-protein]--UDP-n-acetylglucosamine o-acyltransferase mitochondrial n=1 Tax=Phtheirospermum japonicum TaxID=374723 RepID=A0A830CDM2_9LAMI|nr:probable acyl-[acyl-carrier-protein]--UDP-n-acetylglucosamine o-acyltransferase mitochondrial [Phtheirospermum japonicum]
MKKGGLAKIENVQFGYGLHNEMRLGNYRNNKIAGIMELGWDDISFDVRDEVKLSCAEAESKFSSIHPSAIVHPDAILGQGVSIGPFCTVGPSAKLGNACHLYPGSHVSGNTELGDNCTLMMGAVVGDDLPGRTVIGYNNIIGHHAVVGIKCQDMKFKVIGDKNLIMGSCHIAHDCKVGNNNIFANNTLLAGHVTVEDYTHTAGAIVIHQFCHIGSFSFIGGGSVVSQDVPNYTMVSGERAELRGLNLEGLRRRGFSSVEIKRLRAAYIKIFMPRDGNFRSIEDRLSTLEKDEELGQDPAVHIMIQSIRDSFVEGRRGICKFRPWSGS